MRFATPAIVCALRGHGEHGAVVRLMTPEHGLQAAYVRGARGRRMRPVLMAGNQVEAQLSARTETQLPHAAVELVHSRGPLLSEPLLAAAIEWATVLTATVLPEGQPYPRLYEALDGLLDAIEAAPSASGWGAALVRYELLVLAELGFGLDLERCAGSGQSQNGAGSQCRGGRALCRQASPAARIRPRWRERILARNRAGLCAYRSFPHARPDHRPVASARRSACSAGRAASPCGRPCLVVSAIRPAKHGRVTIDTLAMLFPNLAVTRGIAVRVAVSFLAEQSDPSTNRWFWSYHVRIENGSDVAVQLLSRSWSIVDGRGTIHEVVGEGVVGEMPLIAPGASFDYVSGCPLDTPSGAMSGTYRMVDEDGTAFDVEIPRFQLLSS